MKKKISEPTQMLCCFWERKQATLKPTNPTTHKWEEREIKKYDPTHLRTFIQFFYMI